MIFSSENILLIGSILLFVSIVISKTGSRFGIPTLLLFLFVGMLFGSDGLGIQFHDMADAQFIGMTALIVILFSGGMDTKIEEIRPVWKPGVILSTLGVLLTALLTGLFIWFLSGMSWTNIALPLTTSLLLASTMSSTDSASVFAILRSQKMNLKHNLRPMLELESGSNDPMAYMLTIALIQLIQNTGGGGIWGITFALCIQFIVGLLVGFLMGQGIVFLVNKLNIGNQSLYPILVLSLAFFTFSITDVLHGNGYLAVYITGIIVGNKKIMFRREIARFVDGFNWLFQIILFLTLGLLINPGELIDVAVVGLLISLFMLFFGRPISVMICLLPFRKIPINAKHFVSWVGLRGAVPIIFATYPVIAGIEGSNIIFNIVFFITLVSLIVQGSSIPFIARFLKLSTPLEETGNTFGIELPDELDTDLSDLLITETILAEKGNTLKYMNLPKGTLVMMVKRGDQFLIPDGKLELQVDDKLLLISEKREETPSSIQIETNA